MDQAQQPHSSSGFNLPKGNILLVILVIGAVIAIYFAAKPSGSDDDDANLTANLPKGPYIKLDGMINSDQCPSHEQKRIDGIYIPKKAPSGVGQIENNDFPVYVNQNGYILLKSDTGDNFNIYTSEQDAANKRPIAYVTPEDNKINTKMGCPSDKKAGSVVTGHGASLTNT